MPRKALFILLTVWALALVAAGQTKKADDPSLPDRLSESEAQTILKQTNPKSHVEAVLKVSDARLANALKVAGGHRFKDVVEDVDVYASLIAYADRYARKQLVAQIKDRNNCLKKIEQAIFKQSLNLEAIRREVPLDYREMIEGRIEEVKKIRLRALDDSIGGGKIINSSNEK